MSKTSIIEREKKRRTLTARYSILRKFLKGKIKSSQMVEEKLFYHSQLQKLPQASSFSRLFCNLKRFPTHFINKYPKIEFYFLGF